MYTKNEDATSRHSQVIMLKDTDWQKERQTDRQKGTSEAITSLTIEVGKNRKETIQTNVRHNKLNSS